LRIDSPRSIYRSDKTLPSNIIQTDKKTFVITHLLAVKAKSVYQQPLPF